MADVSEIEAGGEVRKIKDEYARERYTVCSGEIQLIKVRIPDTATGTNQLVTHNDLVSYNTLSSFESLTFPTTAQYDGIISISAKNGGYVSFTINSIERGVSSTASRINSADFIINKGDVIGFIGASATYSIAARWYKNR